MKSTAVFIFRDMGTGGSQKIQAFVANTLFESGYNVIAINMSKSAKTVNLNKHINVINVVYDDILSFDGIAKYFYKLKYLIDLRKVIVSLTPDLVIAFLSDVVRITTLALRGTSIPIIGSERGDPFTFSDREIAKYKKAYTNCSGIVFQLPEVQSYYGINTAIPQVVIPNPSIPRNNEYKSVYDSRSKLFVSAGRLTEQKRFDILIKAFSLFHIDHIDYELKIYGDGPLRQNLLDLINELNANEYIKLCGDSFDFLSEVDNAIGYLLSSDFEGIPNVLLEAMQARLPCIATDCSPGGARYLIDYPSLECGIIVARGNVDSFAEALSKYVANVDLQKYFLDNIDLNLKRFEPIKIKTTWLKFVELLV